MTTKYKVQELAVGDVVEFPENYSASRYGVVLGGFGMSTETIGSKIFCHFGATAQEAKDKFHADFGTGYARRQACAIVEHITPNRDLAKISSAFIERQRAAAQSRLYAAQEEIDKWDAL